MCPAYGLPQRGGITLPLVHLFCSLVFGLPQSGGIPITPLMTSAVFAATLGRFSVVPPAPNRCSGSFREQVIHH
jgi:hypothetical protein